MTEVPDSDIDAESAAKRRRRSKWDAPASSSGSVITEIGALNSSVRSLDVVSQRQAAEKAQIQLAQQALAKTMMSGLTSSVPIPMSTAPVAAAAASRLDCRIYIGSLHYTISDADIRALFSPFGMITKVDMSLDAATGRSKGFCFVEFNDQASAIAALDMNAFEIGGRKIKVGRPSGATTVSSVGAAPPVPLGAPLALSLKASSTKTQAQVLLCQALGLPVDPSPSDAAAAAASQPRALVIRNIRNEINAAELHAVFLPFGPISFCNFIGQESVLPTILGPVIVRTALMEYKSASCAVECAAAMNMFSLGGVHLIVEAVDDAMAAAFKGSLQTVSLHKAPTTPAPLEKDKDKEGSLRRTRCTTVILENLVSLEDASDPTLKGEIAAEAEKSGRLKNIEIVIDQKKSVKIILTYYEPQDAQKSFNVMNGRFFGGKTVLAILGP